MEATGIERLIEYVKMFLILLYYCRQPKYKQYCVWFFYSSMKISQVHNMYKYQ